MILLLGACITVAFVSGEVINAATTRWREKVDEAEEEAENNEIRASSFEVFYNEFKSELEIRHSS